MANVDNNQVFNDFAYVAKTQVETQQTDKFNDKSNGTLVMMPAPFTGDQYHEASFKRIANLLSIEDAYVAGNTKEATMTQLKQTSVKVAASTPAVEMSPMWYDWLQQKPEVAGAAYAKQLAINSVKLKLNTTIACLITAIEKNSGAIHDKKGTTANAANRLSIEMILDASNLFGDASGDLGAIICHSDAWTAYLKSNVANHNELFSYGSVVVRTDPFGRTFIVTDSDEFKFTHQSITKYKTLLLASEAATVMEDPTLYRTNIDDTNDSTFIKTTVKSQLGWGIMIKSNSYVGTAKSPTLAELKTPANWAVVDANVEVKEYPGIVIQHQI